MAHHSANARKLLPTGRKLKPRRVPPWESRSLERLSAHYLIETELAARLSSAGKQMRGALYGSLYDELFSRVPDHPQLTQKANQEHRRRDVEASLRPLQRFLQPHMSFLEIGPGDGAFARQVAKFVKMVHAAEVSTSIIEEPGSEEKLRVIILNGFYLPLDAESVDLAYSNQVMEHLHPEDALAQLQEIFRVLKPGGIYICMTPNRLSGPHDISKYFDDVATGFHLKEYTASELTSVFRDAGFRRAEIFSGEHGEQPVPMWRARLLEGTLGKLPAGLRRTLIARIMPFGFATTIKIVATK